MQRSDITHPFERHGLGRAPFRLVRCERCEPMATCNFCNHAIRWAFHCEGADRRSFVVGRECINQIDSSYSQARREAERQLQEAERQFKEQEKAELGSRLQYVREQLTAKPELLRDQPHPKLSYRNSHSMRDYVEFLLQNGSETGLKKACKIVESQNR